MEMYRDSEMKREMELESMEIEREREIWVTSVYWYCEIETSDIYELTSFV